MGVPPFSINLELITTAAAALAATKLHQAERRTANNISKEILGNDINCGENDQKMTLLQNLVKIQFGGLHPK